MRGTRWPFLGREGELEELGRVLARPEAGGVVVVGAAGVGKTSLARAAMERAAAAGRATDWVVATRSAALIPFGAVSHLLPAHLPPDTDRVMVMREVIDAIGRRAREGPLVVGVDDAHLLDDASAALVLQLVSRSLATVVATVRSGEPCPDAVTALWKDGLVHRLETHALSHATTDAVRRHVLGGPVDGVTRQEIWRVTQGNPLFLREVVVGALEAGTLAPYRGVWRWRGDLSGATGLAELVETRLRAVGEGVRDVLELLAYGEPLPAGVVERLADASVLETAERAGLVAVERDDRRTTLRLAHPLYGEVLRRTMPATRARAVWRALSESLGGEDRLRRRDDVLRVATWQLEAGSSTRPWLFLAAARQAAERRELPLAERLARAACQADAGQAAQQLLAEVLEHQGRHEEAVSVLASEWPVGAGDDGYAQWAVTRASNVYWGLDRTDEAEQILTTAAEVVPHEEGGDEAAAALAWIHLFDGHCRDALDLATPILRRPGSATRATVWAATAAAPAHAFLGRPEQGAAIAERALAIARAHREEVPWGENQLGLARCIALVVGGRYSDARAVADDAYRAATTERSRELTAAWAAFRGMVTRAQGDLATARASLQEANALMAENDPYRFRRMALGGLAAVTAQLGDAAAAETWLAEADRHESEVNQLFEGWIELDRAWVSAARGEQAAAVATAVRAAERARTSDQRGVEALALYDAARLGGARLVAVRLRQLASEQEGALATAFAAAAAALARRNAVTLEAAAADFERIGALLLAAEAATAAAVAYQEEGRSASANRAGEQASRLLAFCQGARTPLLVAGERADALTPREREIATLAASGGTSREIAAQLTLSVRTVDNHLGRVFGKLGVRGRRELAGLLDAGSGCEMGATTVVSPGMGREGFEPSTLGLRVPCSTS